MKNGKVWGETRPLLVTPLIEIHRINIKPNSFCSNHIHQYKWNAFYCIEGRVSIFVDKRPKYNLVDETILNEDDITTVPPGEKHYFKTGDEHAVVLEIYYLQPLSEDIVRETVGGISDVLTKYKL